MVPLGRRTLFEDRRRALLALGGVGAGLLMVLLMWGILAGLVQQETAYIRRSPADVVVSQSGVRTMQMSISAVDAAVEPAVADVSGVAWTARLRQTTTTVAAGPDRRLISFAFGYDVATGRGGPDVLVAGRAPGADEVVIDRAGAEQLGVRVGDSVDVFGRPFTVSGFTEGLTRIGNTTVFLALPAYDAAAGPGTNYLLVGAAPGHDPDALASRIEGVVPGITAQSRAAMEAQEAAFVNDTYADVISTMVLIGFVIALALVALTLSAVTNANLRGYGVVKAIGGTPAHLARAVATQALWAVVGATVLAVLAALVLARAITASVPNIAMVVEPRSVAITLIGALAVGAPAALLPLRRVLRVDPASAFRGTA